MMGSAHGAGIQGEDMQPLAAGKFPAGFARWTYTFVPVSSLDFPTFLMIYSLQYYLSFG